MVLPSSPPRFHPEFDRILDDFDAETDDFPDSTVDLREVELANELEEVRKDLQEQRRLLEEEKRAFEEEKRAFEESKNISKKRGIEDVQKARKKPKTMAGGAIPYEDVVLPSGKCALCDGDFRGPNRVCSLSKETYERVNPWIVGDGSSPPIHPRVRGVIVCFVSSMNVRPVNKKGVGQRIKCPTQLITFFASLVHPPSLRDTGGKKWLKHEEDFRIVEKVLRAELSPDTPKKNVPKEIKFVNCLDKFPDYCKLLSDRIGDTQMDVIFARGLPVQTHAENLVEYMRGRQEGVEATESSSGSTPPPPLATASADSSEDDGEREMVRQGEEPEDVAMSSHQDTLSPRPDPMEAPRLRNELVYREDGFSFV